MKIKEQDFFIDTNAVNGVSEEDYRKAELLVDAVKAFARSSYQCVYVIDYFRKGFMYVSDNVSYMWGEPTEKFLEQGYLNHINHVPEEDKKMLLEINEAGFDFFEKVPVEDRMKCIISYDFRVINGSEQRMINHKLTPLAFARDGRMWLAVCTMSVSSSKTSGNIILRRDGSNIFHEYDLDEHCWHEHTTKPLTENERSILILSAQGYTMEEIADRLCKSLPTIKAYKRALFANMGVDNISQAIAYAANYHLI